MIPVPNDSPEAVDQQVARKIDSTGSGTESDGEKTKRVRTPVKPMELLAMPKQTGYRIWQEDVITKLLAGSNRSKQRTMKYINKILNATSVEALERTHLKTVGGLRQ